jgi:hypothetical protein
VFNFFHSFSTLFFFFLLCTNKKGFPSFAYKVTSHNNNSNNNSQGGSYNPFGESDSPWNNNAEQNFNSGHSPFNPFTTTQDNVVPQSTDTNHYSPSDFTNNLIDLQQGPQPTASSSTQQPSPFDDPELSFAPAHIANDHIRRGKKIIMKKKAKNRKNGKNGKGQEIKKERI